MPKFNENDLFYNVVKAHPKFTLTLYHNSAYINNRNQQGQNVQNGEISLYEANVNRSSNYISASITKDENAVYESFSSAGTKISSSAEWKALPPGEKLGLPYPLTASISRRLIKAEKSGVNIVGVDIIENVTNKNTIFEVISLQNCYNHYRPLSKYFNFDEYIFVSGGIPAPFIDTIASTESLPKNDYINMIVIPSIFYGSELKKGSIDLQFYYTGSLLARAQDTNKNGELIETTGPNVGTVIGTVLYNEGIMLITASHDLHSLADGYLSPTAGTYALSSDWMATSSWAHFGSYKSYITSSTDPISSSYSPVSSSYKIGFEGTTKTPVITMLAHAPKNDLNWSNNPTFLDRSSLTSSYIASFVKQTGSYIYRENKKIAIKNTVSSSYCEYEEKYKPQTFISKIGIYNEDNELIAVAKLANPVRKTNNLDYTFKLKLDL